MSGYNKRAEDLETPLAIRRQRLRWDNTITAGHVMQAATFAIVGFAWMFTIRSDVENLKHQVGQHESLIRKMADTQSLSAQNQAVIAQRFADHLDAVKNGNLSRP